MRYTAYVDVDAYYVSCERARRPEFEGVPVLVGFAPGTGPRRAVVLSASYEARAAGVRAAMPVRDAAARCPNAVWIPPDFSHYERVSLEVAATLRALSSPVEAHSIDEFALPVEAGGPAELERFGQRVQRLLAERHRLPSSLGLAVDPLVAKIASDAAKPGRVRVVPAGEERDFLAPLPVRAVPGVGPRTEAVLDRLGVRTLGELASRPEGVLRRALGRFGRQLWGLARGLPSAAPTAGPGRPSRSLVRTLDEDACAWPAVESVVRDLAGQLGDALAAEKLRYREVAVFLRWSTWQTFQRARRLAGAEGGAAALQTVAPTLARALWSLRPTPRAGVRTVGVRAAGLSPLPRGPVRTLEETSAPG